MRLHLLTLSLFCSLQLSLAQIDLQRGLVACYSFSGNANDGSGHSYNGSVEGPTLTADRFGRADSAYLFDAVNDYISIPSGPVVANNNFTFSAWAYIDSIPDLYESSTVISVGFTQDNYHYGISLGNHYGPIPLTGWTMGGYNKVGATLAQTRELPEVNTWYHLVLTQTDDSLIMYVDGVRSRSVPARAPYFYQQVTSVVKIGLRSNGLEPFRGIIDDVSIFDRALSKAEVQKLYTDGLPCAEIPTPTVKDVALCGKGRATLTASGGDRYRWYTAESNGDLVFEGNPFITPELTDSVDYFVANVYKNIESKRTKVRVTVSPQPTLDCHFPERINIKTIQHFPVSTTSGTSPYSYSFDFGDGTKLSTAQPSPSYTYTTEDLYVVTAVLTDARGCQTDCSEDIDVRGEIFIPNLITVNADTINQTLTVYYKGKQGYLQYSGSDAFSMWIYNRWGDVVYSTNDYTSGWQGEDAPAGVYFYRIQLGYEEYKGWLDVLR